MYKSLKPWMDIPAIHKPFIKRNGTGAKEFGEAENIKVYAEGKVQVVANSEGKEVVSNKVLYVEGKVEISPLDNIIFEGIESEIKAITTYYRKGKIDIKMVYI